MTQDTRLNAIDRMMTGLFRIGVAFGLVFLAFVGFAAAPDVNVPAVRQALGYIALLIVATGVWEFNMGLLMVGGYIRRRWGGRIRKRVLDTS